jgi:hypothetical protein
MRRNNDAQCLDEITIRGWGPQWSGPVTVGLRALQHVIASRPPREIWNRFAADGKLELVFVCMTIQSIKQN